MRYADLHLHTTYSDGTRSPREVVDLARSFDLNIIAISDHDNLAGFFEIHEYARQQQVLLIAATELSAEYRGIDIHVLAYAFDPLDENMNGRLASFRQARLSRGHAMIEKLRQGGYPLRTSRVEELCGGGAMGRPHIARALIEAGYVTSMRQAFEQLLGTGCPGFVRKEKFSIGEAVSMVHSAGGLTVIAHPSLYPDHFTNVPQALSMGVDGIEIFHPDVDEASRDFYSALAAERDLLITGGSDDHGSAKMTETIGTIRVPEGLIQRILDRV